MKTMLYGRDLVLRALLESKQQLNMVGINVYD